MFRILFFLVGVTLVFSSEPSSISDHKELMDKCRKENDYKGPFPGLKLDDNTPRNIKCFLACLLLEEKSMDQDGKINLEEGRLVLKKLFANKPDVLDKVVSVFEKCTKEGKTLDDKCDTAFEHFKCKFTLLPME